MLPSASRYTRVIAKSLVEVKVKVKVKKRSSSRSKSRTRRSLVKMLQPAIRYTRVI